MPTAVQYRSTHFHQMGDGRSVPNTTLSGASDQRERSL